MTGIILAGGIGSRLYPMTRVTNKHLLPVYDKPMIFYPLQTLVDAGARDILIVTGGQNSGDFLRLLRNGKELGLQQLALPIRTAKAALPTPCAWPSRSSRARRLAWSWATTSLKVMSVRLPKVSNSRRRAPWCF